MTDDFIDLSKFEKKERIGKGGFGKVYIIQKKSSKKFYAAKISIQKLENPSAKEMRDISREVNIMSKLQHPSILKFIGYSPIDFKNNSKPVIITEFSQNGSLEDVLELERGTKTVPGWDNTKKQITIYGIAAGMEYLHSHGIIHRDLKPGNIFLDDRLCPKIADFGFSKIENDISASVSPNVASSGIKGTPLYMAPEVKYTNYSPAIDVYSFSYIVYEILTGDKPFKNYNFYEIADKVINNGERPKFTEKVPKSYQKLLKSCWSEDPTNRPSFSVIIDLLKNNKKYIIEDVDEDDYLAYITFIDKSQKAFNSKRKIIHLSDFISPESKSYQKVKINKSLSQAIQRIVEEEKIVEQEEVELPDEFKFMSKETFSELDSSCKKVVLNAEKSDNNEVLFYIGSSFIEGINKFPKNVEVGKKYLEYNSYYGDAASIEYYSNLLLEGNLIQKNEKKAIKVLTRAATKYNISSCKFKLVNIYLSHHSNDINDSNEDVNYFLAKKYCKEAADDGIIPAMLLYSKLSRWHKKNKHGEITSNPKDVMKYLKLSVKNDDPEGIAEYGRLLEFGYVDLKPDPNKAIEYYKEAYEKGSMTGCALLGHVLYDGVGDVIKNEDEGYKLIELAYEKKNPYGTAAYYYIYHTNNGFNKSLLKEATDLGDFVAFKNAGIYYMKGSGTEKNPELGLMYYKRAMEEGSSYAAYIIGLHYKEGIPELGIKPNIKRAIKYFKYSADNGDLDEMEMYPYQLAFLENGADYIDEIDKYLKKGIELELPKCIFTYGTFLFTGKVYPMDMNEGKKYVKMAADLGFKPAMEMYSMFAQIGQVDKNEAVMYKKMATQNEDDECLIP